MSLQDIESFCVFCYKTISYAVHTSNADSVKKFIKILDRYVGHTADNDLLTEQISYEKLADVLFKCCKKCNKIINEFCETFHQMKLLELQLDLKLDKLVGNLEEANRVPTRWIHLNKVLDETFSRDLINRKRSQNVIREMRQNIVKAAEQRFKKSQPRVLVKTSTAIKSAIRPGSCMMMYDLSDEDTDDCVSQNEDNKMEVEEYEQKNNLYSDSVFQEGTEESFDEVSHARNDGPMYNAALFKERQFTSPNDYEEDVETFPTSSVKHLRKDTKEKPFVCRFCGKRYGYNVSLKGHLSEKHGNEKGVEKIVKKYVPKSSKHVKRVKCPVKKKINLEKKVGKFEYEINKEKKFSRCQDCGKAFSSFKALKKHIDCKLCLKKEKGCGGKPKCGDCGDVFNLDKELWVHQSEVHEDKVCLDCGKQFKMTQNFKLHLEYHKDPKKWKFECEKCGRKCVSKYKLKEHSGKCIKSLRKRVLYK